METALKETPRIFVSYAREDGRDLAIDIRTRLIAERLPVWQDLSDMTGGEDWWEQITRLLRSEAVEHMVLVLTPAAVASPVVRREWRLARQEGVRVTPVFDQSLKPRFSDLPKAFEVKHAVDVALPDQWRRMVRTLEGPSGRERTPFMAGDEPDRYVHRSREFDALKAALLSGENEAVAITAALRGAGGFGKTTLARKLAHDDDVQDAFHHGVLWTTLGETPGDLSSRLAAMTRTLNPKAKPPADLDDAVASWREALGENRCLVVIDDVWSASHLAPFLQGGPNCARLVTTRDAGVLPKDREKLREVPVDEMADDEALAMMSRGLSENEAQEHKPALARLAAALGEWPLLLDLANALILEMTRDHGGNVAEEIAEALSDYETRGATAFDPADEEQRQKAAGGAIERSLEALAREDPSAPARLEDLAVFAEDAQIPVPAIEALWAATEGLDRRAAKRLAARLAKLSLLTSYDLAKGTATIHDVLRAELRGRAGVERLSDLNRTLADLLIRPIGSNSDDDIVLDYALRHLLSHLEEAERYADIYALLLNRDWVEAKLDRLGAYALMQDYIRYAALPALGRIASASSVLEFIRNVLALIASDLGNDGFTGLSQQLTARADEAMSVQLSGLLSGRMPLSPAPKSLTKPGIEVLRLGVDASTDSAAFSPDGTSVATLSCDGTLQVWDTTTGAEIARLSGPKETIACIALSPNGARLATGAWDGTAQIWDLASRAEIGRLYGHSDCVDSVAFSPDGARLATVSSDGTARIWDLTSGKEFVELAEFADDVNCVAFSPDGARLAIGSDDAEAVLWDLASGEEVARLEGHSGPVTGLAFSADGARLATGLGDATARIWDVASRKEIAWLEEQGSWIPNVIHSVAFSPDGARLVTVSDDGTARIWLVASGAEVARLEGVGIHNDCCVALSSDGARLAMDAGDGVARIWDLASEADIARLDRSGRAVLSVAFAPDGAWIATGSDDDTARIWDLASRKEIVRLEGHRSRVHSVAFSPDGACFATGSDDNTARIWDLASGVEIARLRRHGGPVYSVAFSPGGTRLATGSWDGVARVWDLASGAEITRLEGHKDEVTSVAFSPDGARLATGSDDDTARIWDLTTGAETARLEGHGVGVASVAFAPGGARLATGSGDDTARIWDLASGAEIARLEGHDDEVACVAFSPDGARLATGSFDATARIWDLAGGTEVARMRFDASATSVAWSPVRPQIAVGDASGLWHLLTCDL